MAPRRNAKKSAVWQYFQPSDAENKVRCMVCLQCELKLMPNGSTTNMLNHLRKKHDIDPVREKYPGHVDQNYEEAAAQDSIEEEPQVIEDINPLTWLNFSRVSEKMAVCSLCNDGKEIELTASFTQKNLVRHLARKHPRKYRETFGIDTEVEVVGPHAVNEQPAAVEDTMRDLFEPPRNIFVKCERPEISQEIEVEVQPSTLRVAPLAPPPVPLPVQQVAYQPAHYYQHPSYGTAEPSAPQMPTSSTQKRAFREETPFQFQDSSAPEPKYSRFVEQDDEYKALGNLVEKELRAAAANFPNVVLKYQIGIQEELTKMKRELLQKMEQQIL